MKKTLMLSAILSLGIAGTALAQGNGAATTGNGTTSGGDAGRVTGTGAGTGGTNSGVTTSAPAGRTAGTDRGNTSSPPASGSQAK